MLCVQAKIRARLSYRKVQVQEAKSVDGYAKLRMFWSEIGSGSGEANDVPQPKHPKSTNSRVWSPNANRLKGRYLLIQRYFVPFMAMRKKQILARAVVQKFQKEN